MMRFYNFLFYQCSFYWRRWRWWLPLLLGLLLGYWAGNVLNVLSSPVATKVTGNALEGFIWAFGKPEIVYFAATALYIYLVADFLPINAYEQWLLLRLGSRGQGWNAKMILVFLSTCLYVLLLFTGFFLAVLPLYPFSPDWSPAGLNNFGLGLGFAIKNNNPLHVASLTAGFLFLGWFAIGLFILAVVQLTHRSWAGFLCGAIVVVLAVLGSIAGGPIGGQGWVSYLLIQNHLEYTPLWSPVRVVSEWVSLVFWIVWILPCGIVGWFSSRKSDIFAAEQ
jgi:hypothetical protein